ncbi:MAG: 3-oxoacyl-ACP reductase FabG [Tenericutes bacterium]|nr:3-oxoacyl-ACP reductase FabG [Mycoplasmatota bacterium]
MLEGKVAVVTGGTRGIGFATVEKFLENGAKVFLLGSKKESVDNAINKLKDINDNYEVDGDCPNLCDLASIEKTFGHIIEKYGKIDILVNNAGMSAMDKIYDYKEEDFKKIMDLNVNAVFNCSRAVVDYMKKNGGGVILNTSSMVSIYGQPSGCGYPASKFAVNGLTKSLARELGKDSIRVNAVAPGVTLTDMMKNVPDSVIEPIIKEIPLGRIGTPEDIANAFLFLASDMASYITGVVLSVDGAARS